MQQDNQDNWQPEAAFAPDLSPTAASLASEASAPPSWPEIDASLLEDVRGAVPVFPLDILPPGWARWVGDTAKSTGTAADYVALGMFAAVAAVCGTGVQARVNLDWSESLVLWQALVGSPSSGKTPALGAARRQLAQIEQALRDTDAQRRSEHDTRAECAELIAAQWKKDCAAAVALGKEPPQKPLDATYDRLFVPSQIVVADSTVEALVDVVSGNPRGVVMWRDELSAWLANLGRYSNGGNDRALWLEAWAGAPITINRRNRAQPLTIARFPVGIVGTIQPDRIAEAFAGSDDGMAARFLYAWPDTPPHLSLMRRPVVDNDEMLALLQRIAGVAGSADEPLMLIFKPESVHLLDGLIRANRAEIEAADGLEKSWLGKGQGTVARLAALLTLLDWSESGQQGPPDMVRKPAVEAALALWSDYFRPHACAVFNQAGRTDRDRYARRAVRWLKATGTERLGRDAMRREALAYAVDVDGATRVIERLEKAGILRPAATTVGAKGGRPAMRWEVNPALRQV